MARISTRNLLDGGQRTTPPTTTTLPTAVTPAFIPDAQDVRSSATGLTPAQVAAQQALNEAVAAAAKLGIETKPDIATKGNVPTVTVTKVPTTTASTTKTKKEVRRETLGSGLDRIIRVYYDDGTFEDFPSAETPGPTGPGTVFTAPDGRIFTDLASYNAYLAQVEADKKRRQGQSAWNVLKGYLDNFGLGVLAGDIEGYIKEGLSYEELLLKLRTESAAYKRRFSANQGRISKGLRALSEAEYIALEDQYQNVMRRYGMPDTYYAQTTDPTTGIKIQQGFEKFIEGDISPVELEDRIQTAYNRVINAAPEVMGSLRQFYGDLITNGDILAYALDTKNAIENIKRKVTAAEIGGAATQFGLGLGRERAERLGEYGIRLESARRGFEAVAGGLERGRQLSKIYQQPEYTQNTAEEEVFSLPGAVQSGRQRKKIIGLERATFGGQTGVTGGALSRERAGQY